MGMQIACMILCPQNPWFWWIKIVWLDELSRTNHQNISCVCDRLPELTTIDDEKFDVVIFMELIEHLSKKDVEASLKRIESLLKDDGVLILSTPNKEAWSPFVLYPVDKYHLHEYSLEELHEILSNFQITEEKGVYFRSYIGHDIYHLFMRFLSLFPHRIVHFIMSKMFSPMHTVATKVHVMDSYLDELNSKKLAIHYLVACRKKSS